MTPVDWVVLAAGVAAIAWVNWYFFLAERRSVHASAAAGVGDESRRGRKERNDANDTVDHDN
jgi:hypothetical protein